MTILDMYLEVVKRLGEGNSPAIEARISPRSPIAWMELWRGNIRYFRYREGVLHCTYPDGLSWAWMDVMSVGDGLSVQCEVGLSFQDAMEGLRNGNVGLFVSRIPVKG